MKYATDDGKNTFSTPEECRAFEKAQLIEGILEQQIGEYLDSCLIWKSDDAGVKVSRNLSDREFTRRETVIKEWIRWDRQLRPERYEPAEVDDQAVAVIQGRD